MMRRWPAALPLILLAACGGSTATRVWTIEPIAATPSVASHAISPVQIAAVHVPLAIDRLEIVSHDAANRVTVNDFDRWSAPPGDLVRRALTEDLVSRLPAGSVIFPDQPTPAGTRVVSVDILDLRRTGDAFVMQVAWSVGTVPAMRQQLQLSGAAGAGDIAAQAQALGAITGQLADAIAATMTGRPSAPVR